MLISDNEIRDRYVICIKEVLLNITQREIAESIGTSESYLSQLQAKNRKIPPSQLANFCIKFGYSATWILTGKGSKKESLKRTTEEMLIEQNVKLIEIIRKRFT